MDRLLNRINQAARAADRILEMIDCAGLDITNPSSIINYANYSNMPDYMQFSYGASRLAIWDTEYCDYVIKVALDEQYEKYCQHEVEVYEAAVKEGLADNFAWCMCYAQPQYIWMKSGSMDIASIVRKEGLTVLLMTMLMNMMNGIAKKTMG